jgi:hypothetical protein
LPASSGANGSARGGRVFKPQSDSNQPGAQFALNTVSCFVFLCIFLYKSIWSALAPVTKLARQTKDCDGPERFTEGGMMQHKLVGSFDIDDGSLDSLGRAECFVLGVEWAMFQARILAGERFITACHSSNAPRLSALAERHGRFVEHHVQQDGWSQIFVGASVAASSAG